MKHSDGRSSFETRHGGPKVGAPGAAEIGPDGKGSSARCAMSAATQSWLVVSFFSDQYAKRKREERLTADQLAERIRKVSQTAKERLPWLKCARFGDRLERQGQPATR